MKITLEMMRIANIKYSWETIHTALEHNFMDNFEAELYALEMIEKDDYIYNESINELAWGNLDKYEIANAVFFQLTFEYDSFVKIELEKIKYVMLFHLQKQYRDSTDMYSAKENLLTEIAIIHADFGYPEDMNSFIHYMPGDEVHSSIDEARSKLILKFDKYLDELKLKVV